MSKSQRSTKPNAGRESAEEAPRQAILVAGMHRSGTSATAHVLGGLGLQLPASPMGPAPGNELGHWGESDRVYELQRKLLAEAGTSWDDVSPFPASWLASAAGADWTWKMAEAMRAEFPGSDPIVFKDPRICRQVPFWVAVCAEIGVEPSFVIPVRNPLEVAASLASRDGFPRAKGLLLWLRHNLDAERDTRAFPRAFITYEGLIRDWRSVTSTISDRIGMSWPKSGHRADLELESVLHAEERHHEFSQAELDSRPEVVAWVKRAHACLIEACEAAGEPDAAVLDELSAALADADLAYGPVLAASEVRGEAVQKELAVARERLSKAELQREALAEEAAARAEEAAARAEAEDRIIALQAADDARQKELADARERLSKAEQESEALAQRLVAAGEAADGAKAELAALMSERDQAADQIKALEAAGSQQMTVINRMRDERQALVAGTREREARLRRDLEVAERNVLELRTASTRYRVKTAWKMLLRRAGQARRTATQLASWVFKPSSTRGIRSIFEFAVIRRSPLFDREYYLQRNYDVANAGMNPVLHYIEHGARAGLDPSATFSTRRYLADRPDVAESGLNPLYHFVRFGGSKGPALQPPRQQPPSGTRKALAPSTAAEAGPDGASAGVVARARETLERRPLSVSVVIATHNRSDGVRRAILSALGQSYSPLEVIVSDDGSTDGTGEAIRAEFAAEMESGTVVYVRSDERRGSSAARNAGLDKARGELIAYLDSDNTWNPDFLLHMAAALATRDDAATAYCGIHFDDGSGRSPRVRFEEYRRDLLVLRNYIDVNAFVHRRRVYKQLGGFDEELRRLVDWDLVLRYTRCYEPVTVPLGLVNYYGGEDGDRITLREDFESNAAVVRDRMAYERVYSGHTPLRIGYVLWDYPALSQTFVLNEIRQLSDDGYDVSVYFHAEPDRAARLDFRVPTFQVAGPEDLAELVDQHDRTLLHSHFAYPATTRLTWPAARASGVPFTFTVHAVDVFHSKNIERNRIEEVAADPLCARIFAIGEFHREFLIRRGVSAGKISIVRPAATHREAPAEVVEDRLGRTGRVITCVSRFVPKKGVSDLIRASAMLGSDVEVKLYGYGPDDERLRALADEVGASGVRFMGPIEGGDAIADALAEADIFALPCTVDENGDMDGLPTVIGEAMAAGLPVVTTDVSAIPEVVKDGRTGFVVPPSDPVALARTLSDVLTMDRAELRAVVNAARDAARDTWNTRRTVAALVEAWDQPPLDIVMVTHSRDEVDGAETTVEIIRRVYELTTSHFSLTIVDNDSDPAYREALEVAVKGRENATLILLDQNAHWGPAMNIALAEGRSEFAIYVCSKEGFVLRPGWERAYIETMRGAREVAMAGHLISSPAFVNGRAYTEQEWFRGFRNKDFAESNPEREFIHVQGGLFGLRRSAYERCGGFSTVVSQGAVDIEFSYVLESLGWKLASVPTIPSVTKKTRPRISAHMDENTVAAHPLTLDSAAAAADLVTGGAAFCNVCAWSGSSFHSNGSGSDRCPQCGSTPFGRLVYRYVAGTALPYRRLRCVTLLADDALNRELEPMFALEAVEGTALPRLADPSDLVIADLAAVPQGQAPDAVGLIGRGIERGGTAIVGSSRANGGGGSNDLAGVSEAFGAAGLRAGEVVIQSRALRFPRQGLVVARAGPDAAEEAG